MTDKIVINAGGKQWEFDPVAPERHSKIDGWDVAVALAEERSEVARLTRERDAAMEALRGLLVERSDVGHVPSTSTGWLIARQTITSIESGAIHDQ